ncbi:S49 family peptidase [Streptomyces sp. NP160]|uniref:S49 family peptidase n=1 Tax=Streptomyces sp. NP160 TaxID=2586637 RepID=UPI00111B36F6|nr:S49 family peptidase [Streptomyces sp. NP160]TNM62409.1 S49 family peptidase [Streptomyces sp. NP160]
MSTPPPHDPYGPPPPHGVPQSPPPQRYEATPAWAPGSAPALPPVQQQRQRGGFRRGFGLGLGASLGAGVVLGGVSLLVGGVLVAGLVAGVAGVAGSGGETAAGAPTETVWGDPAASGRLLAVPVTGTILGGTGDGATFGAATYGYEVAQAIDALGPGDADGLVLEMNTPGGTIHGSRAIADAVERYQQRTGHRVTAFVQGLSASGGMYAMAGADEVVVDHGSLVGSIGVISGPFERYRDVTGIPGSLLAPGVTTEGGITQEYLSQGRGKDFGNPYRDMTAEERDVWTRGLAREYDAFVAWVSQGRGIPEATVRDQLGAYLYDAQTAVDVGLADAVLGYDETYRRVAEGAGLDPADTRVDRITGPGALESLLGLAAPDHGREARSALEPGRSAVCAGGPVVLAYHGDLAAACEPR